MLKSKTILRLTLAATVGFFLVFISLYPQIVLRHDRAAAYNGIFAFNDLDETAYAAYLQALIDNRPRRSNPYTGVDDQFDKPQAESLFSIQFLAPSAVAVVARAFGWQSSQAMIFSGAFAAFAGAVCVFWLLLAITENHWFAAAATLIVLCLGVFSIGEGAIGEMINGMTAYPYFPFLRRYVPAIGFPFFWVFCLSVWFSLTSQSLTRQIAAMFLATASFTILVYTYFYLWTTAVAWLGCLILVWLVFRPSNWQRNLFASFVLAASAACWLIPYALLLAHRDQAMDSVQLLVLTRMPDLLRPPEILSMAILTLLSFGVWRNRFAATDKRVLFTASLALVPFAVFNQQILTGRSLQPIHYQVFIVNYVALAGFCLALFLVWRGRRGATDAPKSLKIALPLVALFCTAWGVIEAGYTNAAVRDVNVLRDEAKAVGDRLRAIARTNLFDETGKRRMVLPLNLVQGDDLPALAPQAVLWARHQHVFAGETARENKIRFYHYLYFANVDRQILADNLRSEEIVVTIALFGWDRLTKRLSNDARPVTTAEIEREADEYAEFLKNFTRAEAARFELSYLVANDDPNVNLKRIDRWYERDQGERVGGYVLYKLKLRQ